ncbi:conserved hypothetical protein [Burkholderia vietnamiensis]|nr:conserved hypothetical protein [Burkholderia vietnamiensis]SOT46018.1 hypothetical protein F01_570004 [Burkholderia cenocepacia]
MQECLTAQVSAARLYGVTIIDVLSRGDRLEWVNLIVI